MQPPPHFARRLNRAAMGSLAQGLIGYWSFHTGDKRAAWPNLAVPGKSDITSESATTSFTVIPEYGRGIKGDDPGAGTRAPAHANHRPTPTFTIIWWGYHLQAGANDWDSRFGIYYSTPDPGLHAVVYDRQGWGQTDQWGVSTNNGSELCLVNNSVSTLHPGGTFSTLYTAPISVGYVRTVDRIDAYRNGQPQWYATTSANAGLLGTVSWTSSSFFYTANGSLNWWGGNPQPNSYAHCAGMAFWNRALTDYEIARFDRDPYAGLRAQ
jgi:hypothetical protein